jgi:hypothetical protein
LVVPLLRQFLVYYLQVQLQQPSLDPLLLEVQQQLPYLQARAQMLKLAQEVQRQIHEVPFQVSRFAVLLLLHQMS